MQFREDSSGPYTIYGGALDRPDGSYVAAVAVVRRLSSDGRCTTLYQDDRLSNGHAFATAGAALEFAIQTGRRAIRELLQATDNRQVSGESSSAMVAGLLGPARRRQTQPV